DFEHLIDQSQYSLNPTLGPIRTLLVGHTERVPGDSVVNIGTTDHGAMVYSGSHTRTRLAVRPAIEQSADGRRRTVCDPAACQKAHHRVVFMVAQSTSSDGGSCPPRRAPPPCPGARPGASCSKTSLQIASIASPLRQGLDQSLQGNRQ